MDNIVKYVYTICLCNEMLLNSIQCYAGITICNMYTNNTQGKQTFVIY